MANASAINRAIMAQTKFSADPKSTYQRSLTDFSPAAVQPGNDGSAALQLARSLGVLGDTIGAAGVQNEKNKEKVDIALAEKVMAGTSEQDMLTKSAIDILSAHTGFNTNDNPYAKPLIEKMIGRYHRAKARQQYEEEVLQKEGYGDVKNSQGAVDRFNQYMGKYLTGVKNITDVEAFNTGFYDNHLVESNNIANDYLKWKDDQDSATRKATTEAQLSDIANNTMRATKEELTDQANLQFSGSVMTSAGREERILQGRKFAEEVADKGGDIEKLNHILDNVVIGYDDDGTPLKLRQFVNVKNLTDVTARRKAELFDSTLQDLRKKMMAGSVANLNATFDHLAQSKDPNDQILHEALLKDKDNIFQYIQKRELRELVQKNRATAKASLSRKANDYLDQIWMAWQPGGNTHAMGRRIPQSMGELEKLPYDWVDDQNSPVTKNMEWTKDMINSWMDGKVAVIRNNPNISEDEKVAQMVRLFSFPPAKHYAEVYKNAFDTAFATVTVDNLNQADPTGAKYSEQLKVAMKMYQTDPHAFAELYGEDITRQAAALQILAEGDGSLRGGVNRFAGGREVMADPQMREAVEKKVRPLVDGATLGGFTGLNGEPANLNLGLSQNIFLQQQVKMAAEYLVASGRSERNALDEAKAAVAKGYYTYRDTAVPRSIFNGIPLSTTGDQARMGYAILEEAVQAHKATHYTDSDASITVHWNPVRQSFVIVGGPGDPTVLDIGELTRRAVTKIDSYSTAEGSQVQPQPDNFTQDPPDSYYRSWKVPGNYLR